MPSETVMPPTIVAPRATLRQVRSPGRLRDASRDLCAWVNDNVVAAAVDNLSADARIRPETQVFAGKFDVAIDASVHDDALAIGAQVPGNRNHP